ncbi:DUF952 domain-containing protein [Nakamurella antarctica]|uniref:DUF952 domain-containing protein n=1 Tax=Nakamurella antarctica TaxID=1902245 RepID=UPI001EEFBDE4|nr:DUF952 domain-containing protein [Nakamurella antarctica]
MTLASDWKQSEALGRHAISGRGMTLESEGYLHFSYSHQLPGVLQRYWARVTEPVVLLTVDPDLLDLPVVAENTSGGTELFPHLYGPLPLAAVVEVRQLAINADGGAQL